MGFLNNIDSDFLLSENKGKLFFKIGSDFFEQHEVR